MAVMKFGLNIFTPTNQPGDDPWKPIMVTKTVRKTWDTVEGAVRAMMAMEAGNTSLKLQVVEVLTDDPRFTSL